MLSCHVEFNCFLGSFLPSPKVIAEVRAIGLFFLFFLSFFYFLFLFFKLKRSKVILWTTRGNVCTNPLHLLILIIFFFFGHEKSSFCLDSAFRYQSSIIFVEIYTF
jgi:hypothetical protein